MPIALENDTHEIAAARRGQEDLIAVLKNTVASASKAAAGATPVNERSFQATGNVGSHVSKKGAGAHREEKDVVAVAAPDSNSLYRSRSRHCRRSSSGSGG